MSNTPLDQITDILAQAQDVEAMTRPLLVILEHVTGLESTYLTRINTEAGTQDILFSRNTRSLEIPEGISVPWEDTLCKRALDEGRFFTDDVADCWGDSDAARQLGIRTYVSTPVRLEDGSLFGTLCGASAESRPVPAEGSSLLSLFSQVIARQIDRERLLIDLQKANARLEAWSHTDTLTTLPNRRAIMKELERLFTTARRSGQQVMIAFIDLNGFKQINDTYGHEAGDEFLVQVGERLKNGLRGSDIAGRLGGDEFVVIGPVANPQTAEIRSQTLCAIRDRLAPLLIGRYRMAGKDFDYPGASIGVVCADPAATSPEEALRDADAAMYADKKRLRALRSQQEALSA
jgi:diguanylate cyclase